MKNDLLPTCFFKKALTINCKSTLPGLKIFKLLYIWKPDLAYLRTDLCFENRFVFSKLICDLKTWFVFWKLIWPEAYVIWECVGPLDLNSIYKEHGGYYATFLWMYVKLRKR